MAPPSDSSTNENIWIPKVLWDEMKLRRDLAEVALAEMREVARKFDRATRKAFN